MPILDVGGCNSWKLYVSMFFSSCNQEPAEDIISILQVHICIFLSMLLMLDVSWLVNFDNVVYLLVGNSFTDRYPF